MRTEPNRNGAPLLSQTQIDSYWSQGVVYPFTAFEPDHAQYLIPKFDSLWDRMSGWTKSNQLVKSYLVEPWVSDVVRNPAILDAVECILGPNLFVWGATFFAKQPNKALHVGWHQDLHYWGLLPADGVLTVWLALSGASEENGAMKVVCKSHLNGIRHHSTSGDGNNMLMSDQNVDLDDNDQAEVTTVELQPGQFSMHHSMVIHGSGANRSDGPRVGLSINYIATNVTQQKNHGQDVALLVRGEDAFNNFEHEGLPQDSFSSDSIEQYKRSIAMPSGLGTTEDMINEIVCFENIR